MRCWKRGKRGKSNKYDKNNEIQEKLKGYLDKCVWKWVPGKKNEGKVK